MRLGIPPHNLRFGVGGCQAMYFSGGYAIHGAYWHNNFGTPVSHGCVNVRVDRAERLFNWAEVGTPVIVHE